MQEVKIIHRLGKDWFVSPSGIMINIEQISFIIVYKHGERPARIKIRMINDGFDFAFDTLHISAKEFLDQAIAACEGIDTFIASADSDFYRVEYIND